jgi:[NiFe] hydrogenase assembly HybE family chaperone
MNTLVARVRQLEAVYGEIAATRMAGLPLVHPRLSVQAVGFEAQEDGTALGILVTPWFMNLVRLPLSNSAELPAPGQAEDRRVGSWTFRFHGHSEPGIGEHAAASLASPMNEFADQAAAVATAQALLERLRPVPARRGFLFGRHGAQP